MDKFAHLHVHTDASTLDGLGTVSGLVGTVKRIGQNAVAMTDHGTLSNSITFVAECNRAGVKPILGLEGYVAYDGAIGHITLLADGNRGWQSLIKLNNLAQLSHYRQPAFTIDQLIDNASGLICLTGCISSPLHRLSEGDAIKLLARLKSVFGYRLFSELMVVDNSASWERSIKLAEACGIRPVITNDVHFHNKSQAMAHTVLTQIRGGYSYTSDNLWLKSRDDLYHQALYQASLPSRDITEYLDRTVAIAQKIGIVDLAGKSKLPKIEGSIGLSGLIEKVAPKLDLPAEYQERLNFEMSVVSGMGYEDYFTILSDIVSWSKKHGIKVGPGRGSGAGSLILYMLGITDIDPIEYGLSFERFLNPHRVGMPDVDIDFETDRRNEVLDYASITYGAVPIATYARYSHKSLVRDLAKQFSVPKSALDEIVNGGGDCDKFKVFMSDNPEFALCYNTMLGQIRHKGKHAGGVIITDKQVPLVRVSGTTVSSWTQGGQEELSYAGITKFDLLGLSTLSTLSRLEKRIGAKASPPIDGSPVFDIFCQGKTSGIFQFSGSEGIRKLTMDLQPTKFMDIVAINALYRPGTLDSGVTSQFAEWKRKPRTLPELFRDILQETYGAIVYQEQMMQVYQKAVGGSLAEADDARRIIANYHKHTDDPRYIDGLNSLRDKFINGLVADHKFNRAYAESWWGEIQTHTRYSFNKSHATAYSMLAWQCAWFKYNHPAEFYAETLNTDIVRQQQYVFEAVLEGIPVVSPHINVSFDKWEAKDGKLYAPVSAIRQVGPTMVQYLAQDIERNGEFESLTDFMKRVPKRISRANARVNMLLVGAFNGVSDLYEHPLKVLEIDPAKYEDARRDYSQVALLGFTIPTKEQVGRIIDHRSEYDVTGVVVSSDKRTSHYGPYTVYRLAPNGSFWTRDGEDGCHLEAGDMVAVKTNKSGRGKEVRMI